MLTRTRKRSQGQFGTWLADHRDNAECAPNEPYGSAVSSSIDHGQRSACAVALMRCLGRHGPTWTGFGGGHGSAPGSCCMMRRDVAADRIEGAVRAAARITVGPGALAAGRQPRGAYLVGTYPHRLMHQSPDHIVRLDSVFEYCRGAGEAAPTRPPVAAGQGRLAMAAV